MSVLPEEKRQKRLQLFGAARTRAMQSLPALEGEREEETGKKEETISDTGYGWIKGFVPGI